VSFGLQRSLLASLLCRRAESCFFAVPSAAFGSFRFPRSSALLSFGRSVSFSFPLLLLCSPAFAAVGFCCLCFFGLFLFFGCALDVSFLLFLWNFRFVFLFFLLISFVCILSFLSFSFVFAFLFFMLRSFFLFVVVFLLFVRVFYCNLCIFGVYFWYLFSVSFLVFDL